MTRSINNGHSASISRHTNIDSSVAGQPFQTAYAGVSSKTFGTLTFGRQVTLLGDGVTKYDPNLGSQAFSLIGMSGTYAGGGDTEDKRVDNSLKYLADTLRTSAAFGLMYKFNGSHGGSATRATRRISVPISRASPRMSTTRNSTLRLPPLH